MGPVINWASPVLYDMTSVRRGGNKLTVGIVSFEFLSFAHFIVRLVVVGSTCRGLPVIDADTCRV